MHSLNYARSGVNSGTTCMPVMEEIAIEKLLSRRWVPDVVGISSKQVISKKGAKFGIAGRLGQEMVTICNLLSYGKKKQLLLAFDFPPQYIKFSHKIQ